MTPLETPFPYQVVGSDWLALQPQALLADEMGLGKSAQVVRACDIVGAKNILILCPASVRVNWEREFERFSPMDRPSTVVFTGADKIPSTGVVICSYDLAVTHAHEFKAKQWDVLVLDEAHYLKERSAKRTKAIYGRGSNFPGIAKFAKHVWRLTGTPAPNDASELWTHLKSAGLTTDPYWDFTFRYCAGFDSSYGYKITGHKNTEELKTLLAKFMLRRTKEQVMSELPPINYQHVTVERSKVDIEIDFFEQIRMAGSEAKFFETLKVQDQTLRQALDAISAGHTERPAESRLGILESMAPALTTLRRYIGMAKLPAIMEILKAELDADPKLKLVLFAVHQSVIDGARKALSKYGAVTLYGGTPPAKRQANIDKFMNHPKCRVFIGNIQAAGVGIDGLQKASSELCFLEQDWTPSNNAQAAMRVHRIGQSKSVRVRIFNLHKSVDEQVQVTLARKARELAKVF